MRGESSTGFIITMLFITSTRFFLTCSSRIPRVSAFASSLRNTRHLSSSSAVLLSKTTRGGGSVTSRHHRHLSSASSFLGLMMAVTSGSSFVYCQKEEEVEEDDNNGSTIQVPPFDESVLTYDHYNGVTLHLDKLAEEEVTSSTFPQNLKKALTFWKAEGRKGIWINAPTNKAHLVPVSLA
jgi:hypothetical protein